MKLISVFIIVLLCNAYGCLAQIDSTLSTEEYAIVRARVYFQGGDLVKNMGLHPNPSVSWKGVNEGKFTIKFSSVVEVMNYMQTLGWKFLNSNLIDYKGDAGNTSNSTIANTNEYIQILFFKREKK